jgi:biopolymer transport protein ExbB
MNSPSGPGVGHFLSQIDGVGKTILFMLLVMSVATWYLIVGRAWSTFAMRRRTARGGVLLKVCFRQNGSFVG